MQKGQFDVPGDIARIWLRQPNPQGRSDAEVLSPWMNGLDVTRRPAGMWIVDFGLSTTEAEAALFEQPFAHVAAVVRPACAAVQNALERDRWWLHARPAPDLRAAVAGLTRYIVTARVAKHRLFAWVRHPMVVDGQLVVTARADDAVFGVLHS